MPDPGARDDRPAEGGRRPGVKPLFIASADWHLCRSAWRRSGIDGDAAHALKQVVDLCLDHDVDLVAAGDLFDTTDPDPEDVKVAREQVERLSGADLRVFYVQGQHELDRERPWLSAIHPDATCVHDPTRADAWFKGRNGRGRPIFRGLDWQPAGRIQELLAADGDADILICHQAWRDLMGDDGSRSECELAEVGQRYVLTGDYHRHVAKAYTPRGKAAGSGTAYSPGSIHLTSIDEPERKGVFLCSTNDGHPVHLEAESLWLRSRPVRRVEVGDEAAMVELLTHGLPLLLEDCAAEAADLPAHLRKPLVRVAYDADIPGARRRLEAACRGLFHLFPKCIPRRDRPEALASARRIVEGGLGAALEARGVPEAARRDAGRLLRSDDPDGAVDELVADYLAARALDRAAEAEPMPAPHLTMEQQS